MSTAQAARTIPPSWLEPVPQLGARPPCLPSTSALGSTPDALAPHSMHDMRKRANSSERDRPLVRGTFADREPRFLFERRSPGDAKGSLAAWSPSRALRTRPGLKSGVDGGERGSTPDLLFLRARRGGSRPEHARSIAQGGCGLRTGLSTAGRGRNAARALPMPERLLPVVVDVPRCDGAAEPFGCIPVAPRDPSASVLLLSYRVACPALRGQSETLLGGRRLVVLTMSSTCASLSGFRTM